MKPLQLHHAVCLAVLLAAGVPGCGGGGSGGGVTGSSAAGNPRPAGPTGTVVVTVTDVLGAPVPDASVYVSSASWSGKAQSDANGQARFTGVPTGRVTASSSSDSPVDSIGRSPEVDLVADAEVDVAVVVSPVPNRDGGPGGIGAARVDAVSSDGRLLDFSLPVFDWGGVGSATISSCTPDPATETADCVIGPAGFDAPYSVQSLQPTLIPGGEPAAFSAALLVDQSQYLAADDPWDYRFFDLKYFLVSKAPADRVLLAAFASDDVASGTLSQLPQKPVTLFPVENPAFTTASNGLFPTIDSLGSLEGGSAPLYAAIDAMLDYVAANTSAEERRALVVLTDGVDDTCGAPAQCDDARDRVADKSRAVAVPLAIVVVSGDLDGARMMARLAARSGGVVLWTFYMSDLGPVFGRLPGVINGSEATYEQRFRIESTTDGAFQSGRTVTGSMNWGYDALPFAVQIR
jgi:hypothetical protein